VLLGSSHRCHRTALERKLELENDPWASDVQETSVFCLGCRQSIVLDKRFSYYTGFWEKHKMRCKVMKIYAAPPPELISIKTKEDLLRATEKVEREHKVRCLELLSPSLR
jgi:hypothetical protein